MIKYFIFLCILGATSADEADCFEYGIDKSGTNINNALEQHTDSARDCQRLCLSTPGCIYFSWVDSSFPDPNWRSSCWLKSDVTGRKNNPHFMSGPKSCSPGCNGGSHGIPCCPEYVTGDNEGGSEIEIDFIPHTHTSCEDTCKALYPTSVGVTLTSDESRCFCEFGTAFLNGADTAFKTCLFSTISPGCDGGSHGIPCCPEYVTGDNEGGSEIQIDFIPHTHTSCEDTCKAQHPTSVGVTLPSDESRCYCEFGPALLNGAATAYKTCLFSTDNPDCHDYVYLGGPHFEFFYQFGYMKKQPGKTSYQQFGGDHILKYQAGTGWVVTVSDSVDDILAYTEDPAKCVYEATSTWFYLDQGEWLADSDLRARVSPEEQCNQDAMCAGCDLVLGWNGHDWCCSSECDVGWIDLPGGGCVCGH